jgi:hypothetical protein
MADYWELDGTPVESEDLDRWTDDWLDSIHDEVSIAGYIFATSRALKDLDYLAWREQQDLMVHAMVQDGELLNEEPELCSECDAVIDDGEGYDGKCGDCADEEESEEEND